MIIDTHDEYMRIIDQIEQCAFPESVRIVKVYARH